MDERQAMVLANRLGDHPASKPVVMELRGIVREVLTARLPADAAAALAIDETDEAVIVAVSEGRAVRLKPVGDSSQDFSVVTDLLRFDHPDAKSSVEAVTVRGNFSGSLFIQRTWRYDLGRGRTLRLSIDQESSEADEALERALADAAGWPSAA